MGNLKKEIIAILQKYQIDETNDTGITGEKVIYCSCYSSITNEITSLIQAITDPENQPNQYGVKL